jgi:hypothetical protein
MRLTKTIPSKWNGVGFGNSSAGWAIVGNPEWYVSSRNGDWIAINQKTGERVSGYTRDILAEKLQPYLT